MRYPFTLYKVKSNLGTMWHARFWDDELKKYAHSRTTGVLVEGKKEHRREAEEAARKLIPEIEAAKTAVNVPQSLLVSQKAKSVAETPLIEYLQSFWTETSQYAHFKRYVEKKPLTLEYVENNFNGIRLHVEPYPGFIGVTVGSLTKPILREWSIWLASRKKYYRKYDGTLTETDKMLSSRRANAVIQSVRVAIRWAFENEKIPSDPFHKLGELADSPKEKSVFTFAERQKMNDLPFTNNRARLVLLLGSYCGLRRGEMRGLKWGDIKNGIIDIQHNYTNKQGEKAPKWNSFGKVPLIPAVEELLNAVYQEAENATSESYVFESSENPGKPLSNNFFRDTMKKAIAALGITEEQQKERSLSCHNLRHTFVTLSQLSGLSDAEVMALARQKRENTFRKYSHVPQVLDFNAARSKIDTVPDNVKKTASA